MDNNDFLIFTEEEDWRVNDLDGTYDRFKNDSVLENVYMVHAFQYQYAESIMKLSDKGLIEKVGGETNFDRHQERERIQKGKNFLDFMETKIRFEENGEENLKVLRLKVELLWGNLVNTSDIRTWGHSEN